MSDKKHSDAMKKTAVLLMLITVVTKLAGFFREIIISYYYGASDISDAYLVSISIPGGLFSIIGVGITSGFIPMYSHIREKEDTDAADRFTNIFINTVLICLMAIVLLVIVFADKIVWFYASGFSQEILALTAGFTRISALGILFIGIVYIYTGYLHVKSNFLIPALMSFPFNLCIIISVILSNRINCFFLPVGSFIAEALQFLLLLPFVYRSGFRHKLILKKNIYLRQIIKLSFPVTAGVCINQINLMVNKTLASQVSKGGISALNYAGRLTAVIQGIFITSMLTVFFPRISKAAVGMDRKEFRELVKKAVNSISIFVIPASVVLLFFSRPIVQLLFGRGAFDAKAIEMTAAALLFSAVGLPGIGIREALSKSFYAIQDTKTPMFAALAGMVVNIILSLLLSRFMGLGGLALASGIAAIVTAVWLLISLGRKIEGFCINRILQTLGKVTLASVLMGILSRLIYSVIEAFAGRIAGCVLTAGIGGSLYLILIYGLKLEEAVFAASVIRKKVYVFRKRFCEMRPGYMNRRSKLQQEEKGELPKESVISYWEDRHKEICIVVFTYNQIMELRQTLNSLFRQTYQRFIIYIVDSGSTDGTDKFIKTIINGRKNIRYYRFREDTGRMSCINYGLEQGYNSGVLYLCILEAGAVFYRNFLSVYISVYRNIGRKVCLQPELVDSISGQNPRFLQKKTRYAAGEARAEFLRLFSCALFTR